MGVALITPFKADKSVDYNALERLTANLLENGVDYLVVLGTTGETPTLSPAEQLQVAASVASTAGRRVPLVLGLGGNCTQAVVDRLQTGRFTGFDAILSVVPYYNRPTQEGLYQHYKQIAAASPLPVILYNVPARTGAHLAAETTLRLARECDSIVAVKEASGNRDHIRKILQDKPEGFQVISGDDALAFDLIAEGAAGLISVIGNVFPKPFGQMIHWALAGEYERAQAVCRAFGELLELLFAEGNPAGVKCALAVLDQIENELRLPLTPVSASTGERIRKSVLSLKGVF
jgi:4-hydroxy-tetrahydrodipicolinate synthase